MFSTRRALLGLLVALLLPLSVTADTPDYDAAERYGKRLKNEGFVVIPIYSVVPHKGVIGSNNRHLYGSHLRARYPASSITTVIQGSTEVPLVEEVKAGWQPFRSNVNTPATWALVNVGWSAIHIDDLDEKLRPGEYVYLRDSKLMKGSVRDPERRRNEPHDTQVIEAADMLAEVHWYAATKNPKKAETTLHELARKYPGTPAGSRAKAILEKMATAATLPDFGTIDAEAIPEAVFKRAEDETDDDRAAHLLDMAKFALKLKQPGKAHTILLGLVARYPNTKPATIGHDLLREFTSAPLTKDQRAAIAER